MPAIATPANMCRTTSRGMVRKYLSGSVVNVHPSITRRKREAHTDRTALLPSLSVFSEGHWESTRQDRGIEYPDFRLFPRGAKDNRKIP